jgi:ABC-type dipeptide/oligopeptide/nickel transport system ATPase subunit
VASVSFDDVAKVYPDGTRAVSGFDLEISDGEFMVLVGPSGSGRTTSECGAAAAFANSLAARSLAEPVVHISLEGVNR